MTLLREVVHPSTLISKKGVANFDNALVQKLANVLGSISFIYFCIMLDLLGFIGLLIATITVIVTPLSPLHFGGALIGATFLKVCTTIVLWVTFIAQAVIQLIALPVLQNFSSRQQAQADAKTEADHQNMVMLVQLQNEQMEELKNQSDILNNLQKK